MSASADRAFCILDAVANGAGTISRITSATSIPRSSAYRIVVDMLSCGVLETTSTGKLVPGRRVYCWLGAAARAMSAEGARELLGELCGTIRESVQLFTRHADACVCVASVEPSHAGLRHTVPVGQHNRLTSCAAGQVLLAFSGDRGDVGTIPAAELTAIMKAGLAVVSRPDEPGVLTVAVPVGSGVGEVWAALVASGPQTRLKPRVPHLVSVLTTTASRIDAISAQGHGGGLRHTRASSLWSAPS